MSNVKDNDRKALNILNNKITNFCNIENLENNIKENIAKYTEISSNLHNTLNSIVKGRENKRSKLKNEIERLKILDFKLKKLEETDGINFNYINELKKNQEFIESCTKLKGGFHSVWNSKIKKALKKFNKIDMLQHIKMAILNDNINSIIITHTKLIKIEDIEKQVDNFFKECKYKIDDAKKYLEIAKNFYERIRLLNKIMGSVLALKVSFDQILNTTIQSDDIFKQDGKTIFQHLDEIGSWFQSIKNYEVGQKNIKVANTMAKIDVKKFKTDLESKKIDEEEKERIQKEKERIQKEKEEKEEAEKKYKENLPKEIEKHKSLIEKIIEKLGQFKDIKYKGKQLKIGDYKGEYDVLKGKYSELIKKINVDKTNEGENGIEIVQFLRSIQKKIEIFSNLKQNKPQEKSMFEFSDNSITDKDDRFKTTYTLGNNQLTLEIYDRDKLSSKITIQ